MVFFVEDFSCEFEVKVVFWYFENEDFDIDDYDDDYDEVVDEDFLFMNFN